MDCPPGQRKWPLWPVAGGRCGEVAVSEGSTVFVSEFIEYAWFATKFFWRNLHENTV